MAERPSDDWFRSAGWTEFAAFWARDYDGITYRYMKTGGSLLVSGFKTQTWSIDAYQADNPVALHNAWLREEKRRNTPLDPDGWTHLKNVGEHTSGYFYTRIIIDYEWFNVYRPKGDFLAQEWTRDGVIGRCNEHARENGVKSC